jgi:L-threonylcarbamoyladenylate synthase
MEVNEKCEAIIALAEVDTPLGLTRLAAPDTAGEYAHELYSAMREADHRGYSCIAVIPPEGGGIAAAVRDRITRASA